MKRQIEFDGQIIRSGSRIRESVRCLPKGHFQQIRQMFDKQSCLTQQQQKSLSAYILLELPVTDDEKLQQKTTNIDDIIIENDKLFEEYYAKVLNKSNREEELLKSTLSISNENHLHTGKTKQMQSYD